MGLCEVCRTWDRYSCGSRLERGCTPVFSVPSTQRSIRKKFVPRTEMMPESPGAKRADSTDAAGAPVRAIDEILAFSHIQRINVQSGASTWSALSGHDRECPLTCMEAMVAVMMSFGQTECQAAISSQTPVTPETAACASRGKSAGPRKWNFPIQMKTVSSAA